MIRHDYGNKYVRAAQHNFNVANVFMPLNPDNVSTVDISCVESSEALGISGE